jgi:hypothetical protein
MMGIGIETRAALGVMVSMVRTFRVAEAATREHTRAPL